ncbi:MAG: porin, partial [Thermoanaerobaculia bacterium]|nr:porin [Thermoanaerobaculia bacterium]
MSRTIRVCLTTILILLITLPAAAQDADPLEELREQLEKLKISGYIQAEYIEDERSIDETGGNRDEFRVRRGRIKFTYQAHPNARFVLQPDFSSSGVSLKDAYLELNETSTGWGHTLTAGQFKVPFGQEIGLSSSRREVPERSRIIRQLFPGERDRGAQLSGELPAGWFNYSVGVFNGSGIDERRDIDSEKDLIGRIGFALGQLAFGFSGYAGEELVETSSAPAGEWFDKERQGVDIEWKTPVDGLSLRAEYIEGEELGADVDGWYVYLIQSFLDR